MKNYGDTYYLVPNSKSFYEDSIFHAIRFNFDRMTDNSWRRTCSDKPSAWVLDNLEKITTHFFIIRRHTLEEQNERWENDKHLEVNFELRENNTTYIFTAEIDSRYLDYFIEKYDLKTPCV
jgi:hypothetical protein